jgi:hypothetical protein
LLTLLSGPLTLLPLHRSHSTAAFTLVAAILARGRGLFQDRPESHHAQNVTIAIY